MKKIDSQNNLNKLNKTKLSNKRQNHKKTERGSVVKTSKMFLKSHDRGALVLF